MSIRTLFIGLLASLLVTGCSNMATKVKEQYATSLDEYIGQDIETVVDDIGHADQVSEAPNGNRLFIYSHTNQLTYPTHCRGYYYGNQLCSGGETLERWCKTYFEVDEQNQVLEYSFKGNGCGKSKLEKPTRSK